VASDKSDEKILEVARRRYKASEEAENDIRQMALDDVRFRSGDQWDTNVSSVRKRSNRPCFTVNRMPQFVRQITNDQRQNRPAIKVRPIDDKGDIATADVLQGMIRHIELQSNADQAYDAAFQHAVEGGFGFVRITTEYSNSDNFDQEIRIKKVNNQFSCRLDPAYQEPDGSDATWGFCEERMSKDEYEAEYGDSQLAKQSAWDGLGADFTDWVSHDEVKVCEYFYKEFKSQKIVELVDGTIGPEKELKMQFEGEKIPPEAIKQTRNAIVPIVHWCKINGYEVLEKTIWSGSWIPIIPVLGDEIIVDGKKILEGAIRHAKDSQRLLNYFVSSEAEAIALSPKAPFIGPAAAFKGYEKKWETANQENHAFLPYNPVSEGGSPVPPPQRNFGEPNVQAISQARATAGEDIKTTIGIYDAAMGARSNETSGVAIQRRNMQAQTANFHFVDNLSRSIKHIGRQIIELIPIVYDTERAVRIIGESDEEKIVIIQRTVDPETGKSTSALDTGKYDVAVDVGPSFQTKRQEATESMLEFMRVYPAAAPVLGDLIAKNGDWPGGEEVSRRLKKLAPPGIIEEEDGQAPQLPPEVQQQLEQSSQMIEGLTQQLNEANTKIENKAMELESKESIELLKSEVNLKIAMLKDDAADSRQILSAQMREIDQRQKALDLKSAQRQVQNNQPTGGSAPGPNTQEL